MEMQEVILFYNGLDVPTRQILDSKGVIPSKTVADAKIAIQEMANYSQKWHNGTSRTKSTKTSDGLAAIQAQLHSLGREIKKVNEKVYTPQVGCEQCKGSHYTKDFPLKEEASTLQVLRRLGSIFTLVYATKVYKAGKRLLYVKRNKAISLGNVTSKVGIEVGMYRIFTKGQKQSQTDKTEHEIGKSVKKSKVKVKSQQVKDEAE
ncbi:hypothetical protein Tco_0881931 [Tanacetum coccineum]